MDNLTPRKIQRLLNLAEDKSTRSNERRLCEKDDINQMLSSALRDKSGFQQYESSSGIYDVDQLSEIEEIANFSPSLSNTFNTIEMTGRSTDADTSEPMRLMDTTSASHRRGSLTSALIAQSLELPDLMRHSVAIDMSFHSKRDLTADETSLIAREGGLPITQSTFNQAEESPPSSLNNTNVSVGAYFRNRCSEFGKVLNNINSPDRSYMMPSITEVSQTFDVTKDKGHITINDTLDNVPTKQSHKAKENIGHMNSEKTFKVPKQTVAETSKAKASLHKAEHASRLPISAKYVPKSAHKPFMNSSKPVDVLMRNLHTSFRQLSDDTEAEDNSISLSKIADYIGNQSNVSVSDILMLNKNPKKDPLTELQINKQDKIQEEVYVTNLKDTRKAETASSAGTVNTVISLDKLKIHEATPRVMVSEYETEQDKVLETTSNHASRSKSPSSRTQSTGSTVRDNYASFKSGDSPHSEGEPLKTKVPSPNLAYKELDKSVDWQEVLLQKRLKRESLAKVSEKWAEVVAPEVDGFVGVGCAVTIKVTTLTDSWLTARFEFNELPDNGKDLNIELPRLPLLLSPGKSENFTLNLTSNVEMSALLPFTVFLKDTSIDGDVPQKGVLPVNFKLPVMQAMSPNGMNKVLFPPILERRSCQSSFVLITDCPMNLQLELTLIEAEGLFNIRSVQEVRKSDINKILLEQPSTGFVVGKARGSKKQLCRLNQGNAIKVTVVFNAPKVDVQIGDQDTVYKGVLEVTLFGVNAVLRRVELAGAVGAARLAVGPPDGTLHVYNELTPLPLSNTGSVTGVWRIRDVADAALFRVYPETVEIPPKGTQTIKLSYTGPEDSYNECHIVFEDVATGKTSKLHLTGGTDVQKMTSFPIKTNRSTLSWIRADRKEISFKNSSDKKIQIRCMIEGEGFVIDKAGLERKPVICLSFAPMERRTLPVLFAPNTNRPYAATLKLSFDKNTDCCRKIKLFGCASSAALRWSGLATFGETALVRAMVGAPVDLRLANRSAQPAFVCARVRFNLQYSSLSASASIAGGRHVVAGRGAHLFSLRVPWAGVERRARAANAPAALATITVLTGAESTRRRILRIIRDEQTGELDTSLLPDNLKDLASPFEGEDPNMDNLLKDFNETKESLVELMDGLEELTAQIDLPSDFAEENQTIIIADDTVVDYHTLCE